MNNIIFDLDGTLIDSSEGIIRSISEVSKDYNLKKISKFKIKQAIGPSLENLIDTLFPSIDLKTKKYIIKGFIKKYDDNYCLLYKSLFKKDTLEYLKKNNILGIITNKRSTPTKKILKKSKMEKIFDFVICSDTFSKKNTKKDNYLLIKKVYSRYQKNLKTFYIGDTKGDLNFSKNAGLTFIGIQFAEILPMGNYQLIKSIDDLKNLF